MDFIIKLTTICFILCISATSSLAQYQTETYKYLDSTQLTMNIYYPEQEKPAEATPAIIFFFGGGWVNGNPSHFHSQCEYLASKGMIAIAADYRTKSKYETSPYECVADAKSAVRWVKANAEKLSVNPEMIALAGGSAGGHLAAACATVSDFNDPNDDLSISPVPNALILFNPVIKTADDGFGAKTLGENAKLISPYHLLKPGLPPTLIFHGSDDKTVIIEHVRDFCKMASDNGDHCQLIEFPGKTHGFFNKRGDDTSGYWKTLLSTEKFLIKKGFLTSLIQEEEIPEPDISFNL